MKTSMKICICLALLSIFAASGSTVTKKVTSKSPFIIIRGEYVYPRDGSFTITLSDTNIVVQNVIYSSVEKIVRKPLPKPDPQKDFLDWIIRAPANRAQALIEAGGKPEQSKKLMEEFYSQFQDSDTLKISLLNNTFKITYKGKEALVMIPSNKREQAIDYMENTLKPEYESLCRNLECGNIVIKGKGYQQNIMSKEISTSLLQQLKDIPIRARVNIAGDYNPITIKGRYSEIRLIGSAISDIVKANSMK